MYSLIDGSRRRGEHFKDTRRDRPQNRWSHRSIYVISLLKGTSIIDDAVLSVVCSTRDIAEDTYNILTGFRKWQSISRIHDNTLKGLSIRLNQSKVGNLYKLYDRLVDDYVLTHIEIVDEIPAHLLKDEIEYREDSVCRHSTTNRNRGILIFSNPTAGTESF